MSRCKVCGVANFTDICAQCKSLSWVERREIQKKYKPIPYIEGEFWRLIPTIEWYAVSNKCRVKTLKMLEYQQRYAPILLTVRNGRCKIKNKCYKVDELMEAAGIIKV